MQRDEKACPFCAETIKKDAVVCRFCHRDIGKAKKPDSANKSPVSGCILVVVAIGLVAMCTERKAADPEQEKVEAAKSAEDKRQGFHCLSSWNGAHRGIVSAVKEGLRDPDSFEHIETKITPVSKKGTHALVMKYRAKNGFGGMNVEQAVATVKNSDCSFTLL